MPCCEFGIASEKALRLDSQRKRNCLAERDVLREESGWPAAVSSLLKLQTSSGILMKSCRMDG